jgi:Fe-S-cluster-containing dehydrogenase component/DMSO reductase anchor subunit
LTHIDSLLAEQATLTAVEEFSRAHDGHGIREQHYRRLLPARAPGPGQQYAFEVDLDQCSGCKACVTACHSLNGLDDGESWREVGTLVGNDWRHPFRQTVTTACHHCVDPGCMNGCPVLAYEKDPVTGIVRHLDDQCIGCQYCVMKCPYEVPKYSARRGIVRKCDMCSQRLAVGEPPACAQACPNDAITITLVDQAKVRGKFRPLASQRGAGENATSANTFLATSPDPAITLPSTRFVARRTLPVQIEAADAHEVRPAPAHPPLTLLLVLSQAGAGLALFNAVVAPASRVTALTALVVTLVAVIAGTLHLGQPLKAWRSFLGWRRSWFSRELIAFGVFIAALAGHGALLHPVSAAFAALAGLAAMFCSAMIYVDTRRPFWAAAPTFGKFLGTVLTLGAAGTLAITGSHPVLLAGLLLAATGFKLAVENRIRGFLVDEQSPALNPLNKSALLLAQRFGAWSRWRVICAVSGGWLLPAWFMVNPRPAVVFAALALCLAGELIERHLFFVAESSPLMPGGGNT